MNPPPDVHPTPSDHSDPNDDPYNTERPIKTPPINFIYTHDSPSIFDYSTIKTRLQIITDHPELRESLQTPLVLSPNSFAPIGSFNHRLPGACKFTELMGQRINPTDAESATPIEMVERAFVLLWAWEILFNVPSEFDLFGRAKQPEYPETELPMYPGKGIPEAMEGPLTFSSAYEGLNWNWENPEKDQESNKQAFQAAIRAWVWLSKTKHRCLRRLIKIERDVDLLKEVETSYLRRMKALAKPKLINIKPGGSTGGPTGDYEASTGTRHVGIAWTPTATGLVARTTDKVQTSAPASTSGEHQLPPIIEGSVVVPSMSGPESTAGTKSKRKPRPPANPVPFWSAFQMH